MKKIAYDSMKLDALKIVEDSKCCLKVNAVISKAGVYRYDDGMALKSKRELLEATPTARYAKVTLHNHPVSKVIMSKRQVFGNVENPFFERDKIRATLNFDKSRVPHELIHKIKQTLESNAGLDVSIGFYYEHDPTPGLATNVNTGKPQRYDYVMRDIFIDHVAVMFGDNNIVRGRCTFPNCGIGVDTIMRRIALDPFAGYKDFDDCVAKNQDKNDPEAYCAEIKRQVEGAVTRFRSQLKLGGMKENMSLEEMYYPERSKEFNECVSQRMAEGMTRGEAEAHCAAATKPEEEPEPKGPIGPEEHATGEAQEKTPWQLCIQKHMAEGLTKEQARMKCKEEGVQQKPVAEEDQEEETPLERCIKTRMETEGETREQAEEYCKAELAGEHEAVDALIERGNKLMRMREQRNIQRRKDARRHPIQ